MAQLFYDPKGAAVSIGAADAGQALSASLTINRELSSKYVFDTDICLRVEEQADLVGISGELKMELLSAADLNNMATALFGTDVGNVVTIGDAAVEEFDITITSVNAAAACGVWTYNFPRCRLADSQEHVFGVPSDTADPTPQPITFMVLLAAGADSLGTITKS
jgi:hypothetical protein